MASGRIFRGKRPLGWSGRRPETRKHANRTFARKKQNWVVPFCVVCSKVCVTPLGTCPNGGNIVLLSNADLRTVYQDNCRVVRILGDLWFRPAQAVIGEPCDLTAATRDLQFAMGLKRSTSYEVDNFIPRAVNPLDCGSNPYSGGDFGDAQFMHQWHYCWSPGGKYRADFIVPTCCSVQDSYTVTNPDVTGSSPGATSTNTRDYVVPAVTCVTCGEPNDCTTGFDVNVMTAHHIHIDWKKPINLKEDHSLALWFGWETMKYCDDANRPEQVDLSLWGQLRMLVEK